jgi:hypothetical protein
MTGLDLRYAVSIALLFAAGAAHAEAQVAAGAPTAVDALPGSAGLPGLGMSPQSPPVPPAAGGRAPSFGAPGEKGPATFRLGGRLYGYEAVGIGRSPSNQPEGYSGTPLHMPPLFQGKLPYWGGAGATLNASYVSSNLSAFVTYYFQANGKEYQGYYNAQQGPGFGAAYIQWTPDPIGPLRLEVKVGYFVDIYGGPGQWGWGVFGPALALRGYGYKVKGDVDLTRDLRLNVAQGFIIVAGVPEFFTRGIDNSWLETGVSSWLYHLHAGLSWKNQYHFRLHYASDHGIDERSYLKNSLNQSGPNDILPPPQSPTVGDTSYRAPYAHADGRFDSYLAEVSLDGEPWGHVGATGGLYDFRRAATVGDAVWWAVDWTQGAQDMMKKYLGMGSNGNGKVAVIGAEWDFNIARFLWFPRTFTNNAPSIDVRLAAMITRTLATDDPLFKDATGYFFGLEAEYKLTQNLSALFKTYGESRNANMVSPSIEPGSPHLPSSVTMDQRWSVFSLNPGLAYRVGWQSADRIELYYGRRFYSAAVDNNSSKPLDHHMIALGGYVTF